MSNNKGADQINVCSKLLRPFKFENCMFFLFYRSEAADQVLEKGPSITAVMQQLQQPEAGDEKRRKKENILKRLNAKKAQEAQGRGRWDEAPVGQVVLAQITLETTASQMQASGDIPEVEKRQWAKGDTVVNLLAQADILASKWLNFLYFEL